VAEILEIHGNLFASSCAVLVSSVNCVGVLGVGVALDCRYRFRGLFQSYKRQCLAGQIHPGKLLLFRRSTPQILCFPTKKHWKDSSHLSYIEAGLENGRPRMTFRDLVPLFLVPRTPMLSRLRETTDDLRFVVVEPRRICEDSFELLICDGNAAADGTTCHSLSANTSAL